MSDEWEWFVVLYRIEGAVEESRLGPFLSEAIADKADAGLNSRIDKRHFYTRILKRRRRTGLKEWR